MSVPLRRRACRRSSVAAIVGVWSCLVAPLATGVEIDFYRDVYPILKSKCVACHNKTTTKAALNVETPEAMRKGGDSGEGVVPGNGAESLIYQAAAHIGDVQMPPKGNKSGALNLTANELALLKTWIDQGAKSSVPQARQVVWQPLPPGLNPIYSVALTRDGRLAACGRANQVFVYDVATRQLVTRLADESLNPPGSPQTTGAAHRAIVQSLAFSPDGMSLASGSYRELKIWRRQNVPATTRKGAPALGTVASALTADGSQVVAADKQGTLHRLDATDGKAIKTIATGSQGSLTLLSVSPDATKAAGYGADGTLSLWSLAEGERIASKEGLVGLRTLAWTRDGNAIVTGGEDKVVRVWPLPTGEKPELVASNELKGATGAITALETGTDLLLAASANGKVRVWKLPEANPGREFTIPGVVALGLSSDSKLFATGRADGVVQVWDLAAGKAIIDLSGDAETNAHLAALDWVVAAEGLELTFQKQEVARIEAQTKALDGLLTKANETIATVRKDLVEKANALKQATDAKETAQKTVTTVADEVAKAPDSKPDATLEKSLKEAQDKLTAAALAESTALEALKAREIHFKDAEVEAQNYTAAQSRNKDAVAEANAATAKAKETQDKATADAATTRKAAAARKLQPLAVRFSADTQTVAAAWSDGSVRVWAVASGLPIQHVPGIGETTAASLVSCTDGGFAATTADGSTARVSNGSQWVLERTLGGATAASPFVDRVNALRFSPDGKTLAAGGGEPTRSGDISLWDVASGKLLNEWKERHTDAVLSLDFSPDGKRLASGGADKIARVTEIASGKLVNVFEGHTHHVLGVSFRADGRVLATAGADNAVVVWDLISGERKKKIEGWNKEVTSLQFIGATNQIVTSAGDNLVRIVDDQGGQVRAMAKLPEFMQSAASATTASVIIGGGEDSLLRVWNGTNGQELAAFGADSNAKMP
ncbi:WD40 repeat [Singulisphaera sp. GP187]|uniref:c-type cytochrome domain-containing protein n=1 Tax=Singulisphaera sp. GP187 TaxID=1882752 RepID=UPI00092B6F60|nr:c-type cytochrome domain-containing protein [Singulisphaera sp. GP187]SIN79543.1 WD40 repeat [Singulisphaera sp. GP187]